MVLARKIFISNSKHQNKQKYILYLAILVSGYFNAGTKLVHLKREEEDRKGNLTSKFFLNKKCIISAFLHIALFYFVTDFTTRYNFRLLDTHGWNFRHAHFHEEGRRTLYKAYGIKFVIIVQGRAGKFGASEVLNDVIFGLQCPGKFDLKNTVINIVAGLGLLSFITMFCDFILLNYVSERSIVS